MTFGQKIRELRIKAEYTQEELAVKVGKGKSYICNIEKGTRTTKLENIPALAEALNVSISELIGTEAIEPSNPYLEYIPYLAQASEERLESVRILLGMPVQKKNGSSMNEAVC